MDYTDLTRFDSEVLEGMLYVLHPEEALRNPDLEPWLALDKIRIRLELDRRMK